MKRREVIALLGTSSVIPLAGCSDTLESGENRNDDEENDVDYASVEIVYSISSDVQREAAYEIHPRDRVYNITPEEARSRDNAVDLFQGHPVRKELESFLSDEELTNQFKDNQLSVLLDLEDQYSDREFSVEETRNEIISEGWLYKNDWTQDGVPHVTYDETKETWELGPAAEDPLKIHGGHNPVPLNFYNHNGEVHDPRTGEYLGFQPHQGDTVGLKGDRNGEGSIVATINNLENAEFVNETNPEDLNPNQLHTFLWIDYQEDIDSEGDLFPTEALPHLDEMFTEKVPAEAIDKASRFHDNEIQMNRIDYTYEDNRSHGKVPSYKVPFVDFPDSTQVDGINFHPIRGYKYKAENTSVREDITQKFEEIPPELHESLEYLLVVNDLVNSDGREIGGAGSYWGYEEIRHGGQMEDISGFGEEPGLANAKVASHETFGHGLGRIRGHPESGESVMSLGTWDENDFRNEEWARILAYMSTIADEKPGLS